MSPIDTHEARSNPRGLSGKTKAQPARNGHEAGAPTSIARFHAAQRSLPVVLGFAAMIAAFVGIMFVPMAAALLKVPRGEGLSIAVVLLACTVAALTAYHLTGLSRLYVVLDAVESIVIQGSLYLLIYRSGNALSIFWLAYLVHVQVLAGFGVCVQNMALIAAGPGALVVTFWLKGDPSSALLSLLVCLIGVFLFSVMAHVYSSLEASLAREAELKNSLARLRVAEERSRIARDLHDGVAGELAALAWRLRHIALRPEVMVLDASETDVGHIEGRIRSVLENLRQIVLDLRHEHRSWADTIAVLRERCQDLCGTRQLIFDVSVAPNEPLAVQVADDIEYIVSELVHNATAHGNPQRVEVRIRISDAGEVTVVDDGTGFRADYGSRSSGGLANLRARVARLGGELDIQSANPGTQVEVRFPTLSHSHGMVRSRADS